LSFTFILADIVFVLNMRLHEDRITNFCERYFYEYLYNFYADMFYTMDCKQKILKD